MREAALFEPLFHTKHPTEQYLAERFPEVTPREFYREIFPEGELEKRGEYVDGKYCGIAVQIPAKGRVKRFSVTDDLDVIDELVASDDFCIMSPISYAGKSQRQKNARFMHALAIDLDSPLVENGSPNGIINFFFQARNGLQVVPTFIVSSGTGLHLYYVFERPIALFPNVIKGLERLRHEYIRGLWTKHITTLYQSPQYESVTQAFRMVGSITKSGDRVRAYRTGGYATIDELNDTLMVYEGNALTEFSYKSELTIAQAREKYPEWYQRRIVEKQPRGAWVANRALYDWWKKRASEVRAGHRYFYVMALAAYAKKCGISEDELLADARAAVPVLNDANETAHAFEEHEAVKACELFYQDYAHELSRDMISRISGIVIAPNKRNGRKQKVHVAIMNATRDIIYSGDDWRYHGGAPTKREQVQAWRKANPNGRKIDCERETGISRPTILKWWDS